MKVRGFRIELGAIEQAVLAHPGVAQAAVVAHADPSGDRRLVGYVVGSAGGATLSRYLADTLPAYMIPGQWISLPELPLGPTGKVNRPALRAPAAPPKLASRPLTGIEELFATWYAELLGLAEVSPDTDFFAVGGHSLLALRLAARINDVLALDVPGGHRVRPPEAGRSGRRGRRARTDRRMTSHPPAEGRTMDDTQPYVVVINDEEQYSIWPADRRPATRLAWRRLQRHQGGLPGPHRGGLDRHAPAQPAPGPGPADRGGRIVTAPARPRAQPPAFPPRCPRLRPARRNGPVPLSLPQERVWFFEQLSPGNLAYNFQATVSLHGQVDTGALRAALDEIVRRHEIREPRSSAWVGRGSSVRPRRPVPRCGCSTSPPSTPRRSSPQSCASLST